jgi:hypothetical protein
MKSKVGGSFFRNCYNSNCVREQVASRIPDRQIDRMMEIDENYVEIPTYFRYPAPVYPSARAEVVDIYGEYIPKSKNLPNVTLLANEVVNQSRGVRKSRKSRKRKTRNKRRLRPTKRNTRLRFE